MSDTAPNEAIYRALEGDDTQLSRNELKRAGKFDDEEIDAHLDEWKTRLWVETDSSGKVDKFKITDIGRRAMAARYDRDQSVGNAHSPMQPR